MSENVIRCEFKFQCPLKWEDLEKLSNEKVRFCKVCEKDVHFAGNESEFIDLAGRGGCIAFKTTEAEREVLTISNNKFCKVCNTPISSETPFCLVCGNITNEFPNLHRVTMGIPALPPEHFQKEEKTIIEENNPWWKLWK